MDEIRKIIDPYEVEKTFIYCWVPEDSVFCFEEVVSVEGIRDIFKFDRNRLEEKREQIKGWLSLLPHNFRMTSGGGWSFLNACEQEDGYLWTGFQETVDHLFSLGMGLGLVTCLMPREYWSVLPGGMPFYAIVDIL